MLESVYVWIRGIAFFMIISFIAIYISGSLGRKNAVRFYISVLLLLIILKPAAALTGAENIMNSEINKAQKEIEYIIKDTEKIKNAYAFESSDFNNTIFQASDKGIKSEIEKMAINYKLNVKKIEIEYDEDRFEKKSEVAVKKINIIMERVEQSKKTEEINEKFKEAVSKKYGITNKSIHIS